MTRPALDSSIQLVKIGHRGATRARLLNRSLTTPAVLELVLVGGAALYVLALVGAALLRLGFGYPLEITEGASLGELRGILRGQPLYTEPSLEHVSMIYGPVFYYAAALVALVVGPTYAALRLVSLLASLASLGLVWLIVRRETGNRLAGSVAAGVLAASYPLANGTFDLARVDASMLALLVGGIYAARLQSLRSGVIAGGLMALAVLTKQSAAPVALLTVVYLLVADLRRALAYGLAFGATLAIPLALIFAQSGRWAWLFLLQLPRQHQIDELRIDNFWRPAVLPYYSLALPMGLLFLLARLRVKDGLAVLFYGLLALGMLGMAWLSDANPGASSNVLLPAYAALSILFGLGLAEGLRQTAEVPGGRTPNNWVFAISVGILELLLLVYNPRSMVPYRSDAWANDRLASTLAALPGKVYAPDFEAYLRQSTDGTEQPYAGSFAELVGGYGGHPVPEGEALLQTLRDRLSGREYDYVVLEPDSQWFFFSGALRDAGYVDAGPLFPADDEFWLWHGRLTPRAEVYVPQERLSAAAARLKGSS